MVARADAELLLRRVGFGGSPGEIDALEALSWSQAVDRVLDVSRAPVATPPALPDPGAQLVGDQWWRSYLAMTGWWLDRARTTPVPIQEKMTLFWHGHLTSSLDVVPHRLLMDQNLLYRSAGLGRLDALVQAAAVHPAMLIYLDNRANVAGHPNENFARELLELFCLGVGNYTEADVRESARAWTGHTLEPTTWSYRFRSDWHDHGPKTFLGSNANWDGPAVITHLLRGPTARVAARFIARKLWTHLVHADPSPTLVDELASALLAADLRVEALVRAILLRPEFRSAASRSGLVRSPFEFVVAALRATGYSAAQVQPQWLMQGMGQELFKPPNVDGWGTNRYWISTSSAWAKAIFADHLAWRVHGDVGGILADTRDRSVSDAVTTALAAFGITAPSPTTRAALEDFVRTERSNRGWAERWGLVSLAVMSPEFQLA